MKKIIIILWLSSIAVLVFASWRGSFDDSFFAQVETVDAAATGGDITTNGSKLVHTFTNLYSSNFVISGGSLSCEILIVAGGGAGGCHVGGGGGAGGVILITNMLPADTYTVVIGAGGVRLGDSYSSSSTSGSNTVFGTNIAYGGGFGGNHWAVPAHMDGEDGGSGGGGGGRGDDGSTLGGTNITGQGFQGGSGICEGGVSKRGAGGGGGVTMIGGVGNVTEVKARGGNGGEGITSDISSSSHVYGSGGGGFSWGDAGYESDSSYGVGGTGAGNGGAVTNYNIFAWSPTSATYYGCGGGGGYGALVTSLRAGDGYQGIVIISYEQ